MLNAFYIGKVRHRRFLPKKHEFEYSLSMFLLNLKEMEERPLKKWPISFNRKNYHVNEDLGLIDAVKKTVREKAQIELEGPILLLTQLSYFGFCFNPVSFYYCYDSTGKKVVAILAEITNTPWNERYSYVLRPNLSSSALKHEFNFKKDFHVSPFLPMSLDYHWIFSDPLELLSVHMECLNTTRVFDVTLMMKRLAFTNSNLLRASYSHAFMSVRSLVYIYWEALVLFMKRVPFYSHPKTRGEA